jgi:hypothetical protein
VLCLKETDAVQHRLGFMLCSDIAMDNDTTSEGKKKGGGYIWLRYVRTFITSTMMCFNLQTLL